MLSTTKSPRMRRALLVGLALALTLSVAGCSKKTEKPVAETTPPIETVDMVLASTTSTQDSGLFDVLIPAFEKAYPEIKVQVIAVGTGEAIQKGRDGDADVLLVHAKADEEKLVADGIGTERRDVMYNDFVIVGPSSDPAGIKGSATAAEAFKKIAEAKGTFISRGDDSGTNKKEIKIWKDASISPTGTAGGDWYKNSGLGMGDALKMADELGAYTLADRATFLAMSKEGAIESVIDFEGAKDLFNQYGVIPIKGAKQFDAAVDFMDWITSAEGQKVIETYGVEKYGQALFIPNAVAK